MRPPVALSLPAIAMAATISTTAPGYAAPERDYCSAEATNIVFYLDVTSAYDDTDKSVLIDGVGRIFATLKGGERLSIRTIEDTFTNSRRLLDTCMPVCEGGFLGDLFSDCTEGLMIEDRKALQRKIVDAIGGRLSTATAELPYSEIVRTLGVSAKEELRQGRRNLVYIYSDLIENSEYLPGGEFLTAPDGQLIEKLATANLLPDLWEAEVRVFGVGRAGTTDRPALPQDKLQKVMSFWNMYFAACGATVTMQPNLTLD